MRYRVADTVIAMGNVIKAVGIVGGRTANYVPKSLNHVLRTTIRKTIPTPRSIPVVPCSGAKNSLGDEIFIEESDGIDTAKLLIPPIPRGLSKGFTTGPLC